MGAYPTEPASIAFYGILLGFLPLLGYLIWRYMTADHGLVDQELNPVLVRKVSLWLVGGPTVVPIAVGLSFVNPYLSLLVYLALPAVYILFNPVDRYLAELREESAA